MLNIVIPMAGAGSRFVRAGYEDPKPLIRIGGQSMIKLVIDNLKPRCEHRFIFICQSEHVKKYGLDQKLTQWAPGCEVIEIGGLTEGAACTVLAAKELIDNGDPLMVANSDQYINYSIDDYLTEAIKKSVDGAIMTMTASDQKWSYVGLDNSGFVNIVVEKKVISNEATVGIYNFKTGRDFVISSNQMIKKNLRVNGEFYVAPVYNEMISTGAKIAIRNIGSEKDGMHGLGTPEDLDRFLLDARFYNLTKVNNE